MPLSVKIDESAFLYLDPKSPSSKFAQCGQCMMYVKAQKNQKLGRCTIIGSKESINPDIGTCGFFVRGEVHDKIDWDEMDKMMPQGYITKVEAGYEDRLVRCENCIWFDDLRSKCNLFIKLNDKMPDSFDLNTYVDKFGCCNANVPKKGKT